MFWIIAFIIIIWLFVLKSDTKNQLKDSGDDIVHSIGGLSIRASNIIADCVGDVEVENRKLQERKAARFKSSKSPK